MSKKRTVESFFKTLNEPERSLALEYAKESVTLEYSASSLDNALLCGFSWTNTKEGYKYWSNMQDEIRFGNYIHYKIVYDKTQVLNTVKDESEFKGLKPKKGCICKLYNDDQSKFLIGILDEVFEGAYFSNGYVFKNAEIVYIEQELKEVFKNGSSL